MLSRSSFTGMIFLYDHDSDGLLDYREFLQLVTGGTSKSANDYRLAKKPHPLHEEPHDSQDDEHSSYIIHPPNTPKRTRTAKKKKNKNKKDKKKQKLKSTTKKSKSKNKSNKSSKKKFNKSLRRNSISMLTNIVSKVSVNDRRLVIELHGASNLPPMDVMGTADPFVLITCGRKSVKSKISKSNLNPKFNQIFRFGDDKKKRSLKDRFKKSTSPSTCVGLDKVDLISLVVKDWNRTGPAQFIGSVEVDLMMMESQPIGIPVRMSYPLEALKKSRKERLLVRNADTLGDISRGMIDISLTVLDVKIDEEEEEEDEEESESESESEESDASESDE